MPLRDHFHPPLARKASWDSVHGGWPMAIAQALFRWLPAQYVAAPNIHLGGSVEIDVATFEGEREERITAENSGSLAVATAVWAPAKPTFTAMTDIPSLDEYEVLIYDDRYERRLVAAVELVSPSNKDRPEHRRAFVAKCSALLQKRISVTIVDVVTSRGANLYAELLEMVGQNDVSLGVDPPSTYAVACRGTKREDTWLFESWLNVLSVGQSLPTLPLWLADNLAVPLELEPSYEETCRVLRID